MGVLKEFISFITNMRGLWSCFKDYTLKNKPTGAQMTSFLEQNADPKMAYALNSRPEWQAAKRATYENQDELRNAALNTAQNMPGLQGKSSDEINNYIGRMGQNLGFLEGATV